MVLGERKNCISYLCSYIPSFFLEIGNSDSDTEYFNKPISMLVEKDFEIIKFFFSKDLDEGTIRHSVYLTLLMINYLDSLCSADVDKETKSSLVLSCLLHDIGKSDDKVMEIILKESELTVEEYERVKSHTGIGYDILKQRDIDNELVLDIVLRHGLRGNFLSGWVTLIAIMDSFEAMTSLYRGYREPISVSDALCELRRDCINNFYGSEGVYFLNSFEKSLCTLGIGSEYVIMNVNQASVLY